MTYSEWTKLSKEEKKNLRWKDLPTFNKISIISFACVFALISLIISPVLFLVLLGIAGIWALFKYLDKAKGDVQAQIIMVLNKLDIGELDNEAINKLKPFINPNKPLQDYYVNYLSEKLKKFNDITDASELSEYIYITDQFLYNGKNDPKSTAWVLYKWMEGYVEQLINNDQALDPNEIALIVAKGKQLDLTDYADEDKVRNNFKYYITNWDIDNRRLQPIQSNFLLKKNETCYYSDSVSLFEDRMVTKRINYGGPAVRIKIAKGLSYNMGSYGVSTTKEKQRVFLDSGDINITDQRLIFVGPNKNLTIPLNKILHLVPYSDGLMITKDTGKPIVLATNNAPVLYQYVNGMIRYNMN